MYFLMMMALADPFVSVSMDTPVDRAYNFIVFFGANSNKNNAGGGGDLPGRRVVLYSGPIVLS